MFTGRENTTNFGNYFEGMGSVASSAGGNNPRNVVNNIQRNPSGTANEESEVTKAGEIAKSGSASAWWLVLLGILLALSFVFEKVDTGSTFGNIKLSAYNALIIGLYAVLFISLTKVFFTKVKVPGLSAVFLGI
jgi:hypothetical protein